MQFFNRLTFKKGHSFRDPRRTVTRRRLRLELEPLEDRTLPSAGNGLAASLLQTPLSFEPNVGQAAPPVQFVSHGGGYTLSLEAAQAVLSLQQAAAPATPGTTPPPVPNSTLLQMQLVGGSRSAAGTGLDEQAGKSNYLIGNDPSQWHTNVAQYGQVEFQDVYAGVNIVYHGSDQQQLEYDFQIAPGADLSQIQLQFTGQQSAKLDAAGNLVLEAAGGDIIERAPVAYQDANGARQAVGAHYVLEANGLVGFSLGSYDRSHSLVIDPSLAYSTYLGGSLEDVGYGIAVDATGNAYVTGLTLSTNFPPLNAARTYAGGKDVFVTKLDVNGRLAYSTYLGGSSDDEGSAIAVDSAENAYVTGFTNSTTDFPTINAAQGTGAGGYDAFVTKLNANGQLDYSTYLGGSSDDEGNAIAVDSAGNAYVTGITGSTNFPPLHAAQGTNAGGNDAFVTKLDANGQRAYSTYLGGSGEDQAYSIAVDAAGNAYLAGVTTSTNFPTTFNAFQGTNKGGSDAFVTKLDANGQLAYSTYLGGSGYDTANGIAVDAAGILYVAGRTTSTDIRPLNATQGTNQGGSDAFVTKLDANGAPVYFTYLGGNNFDEANGIAVDSAGNAYITGLTESAGFPTTPNALPRTSLGGGDALVTKLDANGQLAYSTYLGGSGYDEGNKIAVDSAGNAYVTGYTNSTDFPPINAFQKTYAGGQEDAFVAEIRNSLTTTALTGPSTSFMGQSVTITATISVDLPGSGTPTGSVTFMNGSTPLATVPLSVVNGSDQAAFNLSGLAVGSYPITAVYSGDASFQMSTSASRQQTINPRPTTRTWSGAGGGNNWNNPANWKENIIPDPKDDLIFPADAVGFLSNNDISGSNIYQSMTITSSGSGSGYSIGGSPIGISGTVTNSAGANTITAVLTGSAGIVTSGGTLKLTGGNTFTSPASIAANSVLAITNNNSLGSAPTTTVNDGGSLQVSNETTTTLTISQPLVINGNATGNLNHSTGAIHIATQENTVSDTFKSITLGSDSELFAEEGTSTVILSDLVQTNGHNLTIQGVTLTVLTASTNVLGGSLIVSASTTLTVNGTDTTMVNGGVTFSSSASFRANFSGTSGSLLNASGSVSIGSNTNLTLNADPSFNPPAGKSFIILESTGALSGQFQNDPEGTQVTLNGHTFTVHYFTSGNGDPGLELEGQVVQPTITGFSPSAGAAGARVTITGTNFFGVSAVSFNGTAATGFTVDPTLTQISVTVPSGVSSGPIRVTAGSFTVASSANFIVPPPDWTPLPAHVFVTAADAGGQPKIKVFDALSGALVDDFFAFDAGLSSGVRVAAGDLHGTGTPDIIAIPGPGAPSIIRIFDGQTGQMSQFAPFVSPSGQLFTGGGYVAAADIFGNGYDDIIVGADSGGGPAVNIVDGKSGTTAKLYYAFRPDFTGGVRVAAGPLTKGGGAVIFTAAGPGGGPAVTIWSAADIAAGTPEKTFYVLPPDKNGNLFTGGVYLGAVYVSSLGRDYLVSGAAPGGGPAVTLIDPLLTTGGLGMFVGTPFYALDPNFTGGVRVAGGSDVLLAGTGPGTAAVAKSFDLSGNLLNTFDGSDSDNPNFTGGLFVAAT